MWSRRGSPTTWTHCSRSTRTPRRCVRSSWPAGDPRRSRGPDRWVHHRAGSSGLHEVARCRPRRLAGRSSRFAAFRGGRALGYTIRRDRWGQGLATEVATALVGWHR
ncbi:GNAT family N-acetyltransferase [Nostocoides australiense]